MNKPGPLLVGLEENERNPLLLKAKGLKSSERFKNIYLGPDLTEAERLEDSKLRQKRDELNKTRDPSAPFRYAIRGSGIIKLKLPAGAELETARN